MVKNGHLTPSRNFWAKHHGEHEQKHSHDMKELSTLSLPVHIEENALARLYRENKYRITLSATTKNLLLLHLEEMDDQGGRLILNVLNTNLDLRMIPGRAAIFQRGDDASVDQDGIQGHVSGGQTAADRLVSLKLGQLPMEKDLAKDVEEELREEDARAGSRVGVSLVEEFQRIKREESEDSPARDAIPLPPYTVRDIEREVLLVKDHREAVKLQGGPNPALPTVCMYTFHNTNDGYIYPLSRYLRTVSHAQA